MADTPQALQHRDVRCLSRFRTCFAVMAMPVWYTAAAQTPVKLHDVPAAREAFAAAAAAPRLRCSFTGLRPALDYALRFRTGYTVSFPLQQLAGSNHRLAVLLRVTPDGGPPVYLARTGALPPVPDEKLEGETHGTFVVGEGSYTVEAVMKDDSGSACSGKWRIEAKLTADERGLPSATPPLAVEDVAGPEPGAQSEQAPRLQRLTILLHASPVNARAAKLEPEIASMLANSLLSVCRDLRARSVRLAVFNLEQRRVLLEQQDFTPKAIAGVRAVLEQLDLAKVDYRTLQNGGQADLLRDLIEQEAHSDEAPSAVVLLSLRGTYKVDPSLLSDLQEMARSRWYYLQYDPVFRLAARPAFTSQSDDIDTTGRRGGRGGLTNPGGRGRAPWNPPVPPRLPDPTQQFFHNIKGETFPIRTPRDLAAALRRMASESL